MKFADALRAVKNGGSAYLLTPEGVKWLAWDREAHLPVVVCGDNYGTPGASSMNGDWVIVGQEHAPTKPVIPISQDAAFSRDGVIYHNISAIYCRAEECESAHFYLDRFGIPSTFPSGETLSLLARISWHANEMRNMDKDKPDLSDIEHPEQHAKHDLPIPWRIIEVIASECAYQENEWKMGQNFPYGMGSWMNLMRRKLRDAENAYEEEENYDAVLANLRKVVALGVACFEQYGVPERSHPEKMRRKEK